MSFGFCHDQRWSDLKKKSDLWIFQVFPSLATGSFGCEQTSIPVWSPLCAQRWLCLAGNLSDLLDFCAALYSEAPVPVWASSSLRFLLPTASTNCFPWKSKGSWSNEFSYSVHSLEVSGSLCDFCTCRFFFFFFFWQGMQSYWHLCVFICVQNHLNWTLPPGIPCWMSGNGAEFFWELSRKNFFTEGVEKPWLRKVMDAPGLLVFEKGLENALSRFSCWSGSWVRSINYFTSKESLSHP